MGKRLGILIGINQYQDSSFRPLQYAEVDTRAFAQWLANPRGGNWNISELQVLLGAQATKEAVEAQLIRSCLQMAEPGDVILLYFAGHTFVDEGSGEGLLACANTFYRQPGSGIHLFSLVRDILVRSPASQIILALDCFQTGNAWNMRRATPYDFQPLLGQALALGLQQTQGRLLYCSCRGSDIAPESGEQHLGTLMYRVIVGLSGPALDSATRQGTLQKLHAYLLTTLDAQHQPQIFGQESRPIVLVGELPQLISTASPAQHTSRPYTTGTLAPPSSPAGQITFQGVVEDDMLAEPAMQQPRAATAQISRPISISMVEENLQQQCAKLMQQARQQLAMQNLPAALNVIDQVLQMAPSNSEALTMKGQILGATGRFQEAKVVVEQLLTVEPNNALAWSMRAALLMNLGRPQEALAAVERSLALEPNNPETLAIRHTIQANTAAMPQPSSAQNMGMASGHASERGRAGSFLLAAGLQLLAMVAGVTGASILVLQPHLPILIGFVLESLGLAALCILAARGSYRYGFWRFLFSLALCLAAIGMLGGLYKFGYSWLIGKVVAFPPLIVPVLFLGFWLIAAAALPFLAGLGGLILGLILGTRRKA